MTIEFSEYKDLSFRIETTMVTTSLHEDLEFPSVDIFTFLFKREDQKFPNSHRMHTPSPHIYKGRESV